MSESITRMEVMTYADQYLPKGFEWTDKDWLAIAVDHGWLTICPNCHFPRPPKTVIPWDDVYAETLGEPGLDACGRDACGVCYMFLEQATFPYTHVEFETYLKNAAEEIKRERARHVEMYYQLWMAPTYGAEAMMADFLASGFSAGLAAAKRSLPNLTQPEIAATQPHSGTTQPEPVGE